MVGAGRRYAGFCWGLGLGGGWFELRVGCVLVVVVVEVGSLDRGEEEEAKD